MNVYNVIEKFKKYNIKYDTETRIITIRDNIEVEQFIKFKQELKKDNINVTDVIVSEKRRIYGK